MDGFREGWSVCYWLVWYVEKCLHDARHAYDLDAEGRLRNGLISDHNESRSGFGLD